MIVTEGGKNIYPEDIETVFEGLPVKEFCVFASHYLWPPSGQGAPMNDAPRDERLIAVLHPDSQPQSGDALRRELAERNRRLPDFKRISGYVVWDADFPRTASLKIKRDDLAGQIRKRLDRQTAVVDL